MKNTNSSTRAIQAGLERCQRISDALAKEEKLVVESAAELRALEVSADLFDGGVVTNLSKLHIITTVGPIRVKARAAELDDSKKQLLQLSAEFARTSLSPRFREIESRALAKVEASIRSQYSDADSLRQAAYQSSIMQQLLPLERRTIVNDYAPEAAMPQAETMLQTWQALGAIEQQHLS